VAEAQQNREDLKKIPTHDVETAHSHSSDDVALAKRSPGKSVLVTGINRPLFHIDLTAALQSAVANAQGVQAAPLDLDPESLPPKI
jgi:hypothetical protein